MSTLFNSSTFTPTGAVTQAQLTKATNACVKKTQLTTTGVALGVPQYDASANLTTTGQVNAGSGINLNSTLNTVTITNPTSKVLSLNYANTPTYPISDTTSNILSMGGSNAGGTIPTVLTLTNRGSGSIYMGVDNVGSTYNRFLGTDGNLQFRTGMSFTATNVSTTGTPQLTITSSSITSALPVAVGSNNITQTGASSISTGNNGIICNGTLAMGANSITETGNITQTGAGSITSGSGGITCNGTLAMGANSITETGNITQSGAGGITTGTGGISCSGNLVGPTPTVFTSGSSAGQYTLSAFAGTGATASVSGNSQGGQISITTGSSTSTGSLIQCWFPLPYPNGSYVMLTPVTSTAATANAYVSGHTAAYFVISVPAALTASGIIYTWMYGAAGY